MILWLMIPVQCQWHQEGDQDKGAETGYCDRRQIPWGSFFSHNSSKPEVLSRIAQATAALRYATERLQKNHVHADTLKEIISQTD